MQPKLTIGMAVYDDYDGVFFTASSLLLYQNLPKDTEILIVDNNPHSKHGKETKDYAMKISATYIPYTKKTSTSVRDVIFKDARNDYVLSLDSHVLLHKGAIESLIKYYQENPDSKDIISGPLCCEKGNIIATMMKPEWNDNMYGVWGNNGYKNTEPFETPMMGLGIFSCKKSNWPKFNPHFIGFGAEEGYIHEKIRQKGGKSICIPKLKWLHRFSRPNGVMYRLNMEDRIFNYFIGWLELTQDPEHEMVRSIKEHFIEMNHDPYLIQKQFLRAMNILAKGYIDEEKITHNVTSDERILPSCNKVY